MKTIKEYLGKVSITCNGLWDVQREYDRLCLVHDGFFASYISRKNIPAGTALTNTEYWQPVANLRDDVRVHAKEFEDKVIELLAQIQIKLKNARIVVKDIAERDALTITEVAPGCEVYVKETQQSWILDTIVCSPGVDTYYKEWHLEADSKIDAEEKYELEGQFDNLTADRAICDAYGNIIHDTYITRETVHNFIDSVIDEFLSNWKYEIQDGTITYDMLSQQLKDMFKAGEGTAITNMADEEDFTVKDNQLKFKDREYQEDSFNGMGYVILRKNWMNNINLLEQSMINKPNTIYEIRYDFCLDGATITIPNNCILKFNGGSIRNGKITINNTSTIDISNGQILDCQFAGSRPNIIGNITNIKNTCTGSYLFLSNGSSEWTWDVTNLPAWLSKYNLKIGENVEDNADKLNALFNSTLYKNAAMEHKINLLFPCSNSITSVPNIFLFKKPIKINSTNASIILGACIKFDFSNYTYRSIEDIKNNKPEINVNCFEFTSCPNVTIIGNKSKNLIINDKTSSSYIDCGENTIKGDYYIRQQINGKNYYTTDGQYGILIQNSDKVNIDGIEVFNTQYAISVQARYANIENCYIHDVVNDNGITVLGAHTTYMDTNNMSIIKNCRIENVKGVGINIQSYFGIVENCLVKNTGNNCINEENYGTRGSGVAGGAYSVESLSDNLGNFYYKVNVQFINCKAKDCYNYAFGSDSGGIILINCQADNIISTYNENVDNSQFLYSSNSIRKGAFFHLGNTQFLKSGGTKRKIFPCFANNCFIQNVDKIYYNQNNNSDEENKKLIPYFTISNSYINSVPYTKFISDEDIYSCYVNNCILDGTVNTEKLITNNCYNFIGEKIN